MKSKHFSVNISDVEDNVMTNNTNCFSVSYFNSENKYPTIVYAGKANIKEAIIMLKEMANDLEKVSAHQNGGSSNIA